MWDCFPHLICDWATLVIALLPTCWRWATVHRPDGHMWKPSMERIIQDDLDWPLFLFRFPLWMVHIPVILISNAILGRRNLFWYNCSSRYRLYLAIFSQKLKLKYLSTFMIPPLMKLQYQCTLWWKSEARTVTDYEPFLIALSLMVCKPTVIAAICAEEHVGCV
jgi:hypothetical protein